MINILGSMEYLTPKVSSLINAASSLKEESSSKKKLSIINSVFSLDSLNNCINQFGQLQTVIFKNNNLDLEFFLHLFKVFEQSDCQIRQIDLSQNMFNDLCFQQLQQSLTNYNKLESLKINGHYKIQQKLEETNLTANQTNYELDKQNIQKKESNHKKDNNQKKDNNKKNILQFYITDVSYPFIVDIMEKNRNFKHLELNNQKLSQEVSEKLVEMFKSQTQCQYLEISNEELAKKDYIVNKLEAERKRNQQLNGKQENQDQISMNDGLQQSESNITDSVLFSKNTSRNRKHDYYNIGLSIDGGGTRGLIPATLIKSLSDYTKKEPYQIFDSIGGTSIGGFIASVLAGSEDRKKPLFTTSELIDVFYNDSSSIFGKLRNRIDPMGLYNNRYDESGIENIIYRNAKNIKLSDCICNLIIPAVHKDSYDIQVFRSCDAFIDSDKDFFLTQVARSTSAAPTFFPAVDVTNLSGKTRMTLIDGGVGKNDPSSFVMQDLVTQANNRNQPGNFCLLSFGTGETTDEKKMNYYTGLSEASKVLNKCMSAHTMLDQQELIQKYGQSRYLRFQTILDIKEFKNTDLDVYDPAILNKYQQKAELVAQSFLKHQYGPYQDRSLVEWLAENTDRKNEIY